MLIALHDATVHYEGSPRPALDHVSLQINRDSWTTVVGSNGSGKSTLLGALAGLVRLQGGVLERNGSPRVALLQQDADNQLVATSVRHELALSVPHDVASSVRAARIDDAIQRFDLARLLDRNPHRLSGGEKQRLACATVRLEAPDVLLLDEPLSFLDAEARASVIAFVRETHAAGAAVVWATPEADADLAREIVLLEEGRVVSGGRPTLVGSEAPRHDQRPVHLRAPRAGTETALRLEKASFAHGHRRILESIDLVVTMGECVGIAGQNGAGKSTLLTLAGGALRPWAGRVVLGESVLYLPQTPEQMFFAETVQEEITFGLKRRRAHRGAGDATVDAVVHGSLRAVGLDPLATATRSPFQLSFGEMRRVAFAIAHATAPDLLLLDEPASCLDRAGRDVLAGLVAARIEAGGAVVVASHDRASLEALCHRVLVLDGGRLA